jgi:prepilin-type processing-associated H-X9-DG protein
MADVTDGLANTFLFGERSHRDPIHDNLVNQFGTTGGSGGGGGGGGGNAGSASLTKIGAVGWWAASGGRLAAGDVTLSAAAPINFRVPAGVTSSASFQPLYNQRLCAFGSSHSGGANFALADGSTRFLRQTIGLADLTKLCVRNDGQTVTAE